MAGSGDVPIGAVWRQAREHAELAGHLDGDGSGTRRVVRATDPTTWTGAPLVSSIERTRCIARQRGTVVGYRYDGCRCSECREAHRVSNKRRREHRQPPALVDAAGTHRRIRALLACGWTGTGIARRAGWDSRRRVHHLLRRHRIRPRTAEVIGRVYGELAERDPARLRREVA